MTLKEFKIWFAGYVAGIDASGGVSISGVEFEKLAKMVAEIEEQPLVGKAIPQHPPGTVVWEPCKTVPLSSNMTFDPSVVYNNGAVSVSSTAGGNK